ncbi:MAG: OmpH/Skp family outer membrane protein [Planctomycetota bacterium]
MRPAALLIGLLLPTCIAGAQDPQSPGESKIAVVNLPLIFDGYRMTKDLEQRFEERRQFISVEAENRRQAMENRQAALEAFDPASKDYADRREELLRMQVEYQIWLTMEEQRLKDEHMAWLLQIYRDVREVVEQRAKQRGVDLILTYDELSEDVPDSLALRREILLKKVLYFSDRIDLTEPVLQDLNVAYAKRGGASSLGTAPPLVWPQKQTPSPKPDSAP